MPPVNKTTRLELDRSAPHRRKPLTDWAPEKQVPVVTYRKEVR